ncbi:MAG: hypothetical protein ACHQM6_06545 [Candidatus Kapaibacterium sp.]
MKLSVYHYGSFAALSLLLALSMAGCDRGATEQVQAAQKFADAVVRNNTALRDSMIATRLFRKHFDNEFVRSEFMGWMSTIYDLHENKFAGSARADVDRDLKADLAEGGLLSGDEIEETGMVRVKSPNEGQPSAYFWMVKQKGHHWAVAMVTKGEMAVNFRQ